MDFYNKNGDAVLYLEDSGTIYLWTGAPVGYLTDNGCVYSFGGKLLGWFEDGWLFDRQNKPAFFSTRAIGGPMKPMCKMSPMKNMKQMSPMKSMQQMASMRPMKLSSWSPETKETYFL